MIKAICYLTLSLFIIGICHSGEAPRPNILYFYVDDMGWGSIGPNGQAKRRADGLASVKTPTIDALAADGINFTRAYGCTVCSPARSSQQTGFHQGHTFADRNDPNNAKKAIRADDITMGDTLSKVGYTTGYWGKWGYGGSKDQKNPVIENIQTLPTSHGYEYVLSELHHVRAHTFFQPTLWSAPAAAGATGGLELIPNTLSPYRRDKNYPTYPTNHNSPNYPETSYCDDAYAFATLDFVRTQSINYNQTGKPFFGLLAVQIPHAPFDEIATLPGWDAAYRDDSHFSKLAPQSRQWAAMVTRIDAHFGNIVAALDDPNGDGDQSDSVADDTLVIFMSDNGGPGGKCNAEYDANGGLRGVKGSIYEGGIRVPLVMRWPGGINADTKIYDKPIDVSDFLPTFCELAGVEAPVGIDGVSFAPILTGKGDYRGRDFLIHEAGKSQSIIQGDLKLVRTKSKLELFDLAADRAESKKVTDRPEQVAALLATLLEERVDEPKGFANTYHHWSGENNAPTSAPDNWTDYRYENAGVTYTEKTGVPEVSWTATMANTGSEAKIAKADADLAFLGLEIKGDAPMELRLEKGINLTGRNEIRISENGLVTINGGTVSSMRWVDIKSGGTIQGSGKIEATIYNAGKMTVAGGARERINVAGKYIENKESNLEILLSGNLESPALEISKAAKLAGQLSIDIPTAQRYPIGQRLHVISASTIKGEFSNENGIVISDDGTTFRIIYTATGIEIEVIETGDLS